jgi:gluconolactonase
MRLSASHLNRGLALLLGYIPIAALAQGPHTLPATIAEPGTPILIPKIGPSVFAEGVAADWDGNVYSNEMDNARRTMQLKVGADTLKPWRNANDVPNGMWVDTQNRLIICQTRAIVRVKTGATFDNQTDTLYKYPAGAPSPQDFNDVTGDSRDNLYFTNFNGRSVYFRDVVTGVTKQVLSDRPKPNGVEWDEERKLLYVNENDSGKVAAYPILPDFTLGARREFATVAASDGIALDRAGNVYVVGFSTGVQVFNPDGQKLGDIPLAGSQVTNLAFGGADFKTLYIITNKGLYRLPTKMVGYKSGRPTVTGIKRIHREQGHSIRTKAHYRLTIHGFKDRASVGLAPMTHLPTVRADGRRLLQAPRNELSPPHAFR